MRIKRAINKKPAHNLTEKSDLQIKQRKRVKKTSGVRAGNELFEPIHSQNSCLLYLAGKNLACSPYNRRIFSLKITPITAQSTPFYSSEFRCISKYLNIFHIELLIP